MKDIARKLSRLGVDFLICPDNTIHQAMDDELPQSSLPFLHLAKMRTEQDKRLVPEDKVKKNLIFLDCNATKNRLTVSRNRRY